MGKSICIVCGNEIKEGYPIREDFIIKFIRNLKLTSQKWRDEPGIKQIIGRLGISILGEYQNNKLYVCEKHISEVRKKRKRFERNIMLITGLVGLLIFISLLGLINGTKSIVDGIIGLLFSIFIGAILYLLSLVYYIPYPENEVVKIKNTKISNKKSSNEHKKGKKVKIKAKRATKKKKRGR